jgi:hypothetical protein
MAHNEHLIRAPAEAVFDVLADPRAYAYWVIGSRETRAADDSWPEPGSRFKHTVNAGPLRIKDESLVEEMRPGRFLQLKEPPNRTRPARGGVFNRRTEPQRVPIRPVPTTPSCALSSPRTGHSGSFPFGRSRNLDAGLAHLLAAEKRWVAR